MKKLLSTAIAAGIFAAMTITPAFAVDANALPNYIPGTLDKVSFDAIQTLEDGTTYRNMNIDPEGTAQGAVGTAHYSSFDIGSNAHFNVNFTNTNQTSLNYVDGTKMSEIYGKFTNTGCNGCGYEGTGKVILVNPNGILFGQSAVVDLNSFTASTLNGTYANKYKDGELDGGQLILNRNSDKGITVYEGANIKGDKNVSFISKDINIHKGSLISTNTIAKNVNNSGVEGSANDTTIGKVKLVTSDGVTFNYYNNTAVKDFTASDSADKMVLTVDGNIKSGHIEAYNSSTNNDSTLSVVGGYLQAYKAEKGSDGNIWLTSNNTLLSEDSTFETLNANNEAAAIDYIEDAQGNKYNLGEVIFASNNKTTLRDSNVNSVGNVTIKSYNEGNDHDVIVDNTVINGKDILLDSVNVASVQYLSKLKGDNITVKGKTGVQSNRYRKDETTGEIYAASSRNSLEADNITFESDEGYVWLENSDLKADNKIKAAAKTHIYGDDDNIPSLEATEIELTADGDVLYSFNLNKKPTKINAGNDINVTLYNVDSPDAGLVAEAGKNVTITTPGTLSVSRLVAGKGDMTINADKLIQGAPLNNMTNTGDEIKFASTPEDRALISVRYGKFTSNVTNGNFDKPTLSGGTEFVGTDGGNYPIGVDGTTYQVKHNIQYNDGTDKILLVNPRAKLVSPGPQPQPEPEPEYTVNDNQAAMLNKIPRAPEAYSNVTNIADGRTTFVDVFAAASMIEIDDEE